MKKNSWKRIVALLLALAMVLSMTACGKTEEPAQTTVQPATDAPEQGAAQEPQSAEAPQYIIGWAEAQASDEVAIRRDYLENYIAPRYNVKFIFSETLKDDAAGRAFIENCIDAGAHAIVDHRGHNAQMARLCEEYGLVYTINVTPAAAPDLWAEEFPLFSGTVNGNNVKIAESFANWLTETASDTPEKGFLVATVLAPQGNEQHMEITQAVLEALQKKYDLTYEQPIEELISSPNTVNVPNDKGVLITLYPGGSSKDTWLPGISSLLQSGNYDTFLSAAIAYNNTATVVDEVERSLGFNIKIASIAALGDTLKTAFNTQDVFGNPSIDLAVVKSVSVLTACLFSLTYNALTGGMDTVCREDGVPAFLGFNFFAITSPEQLAEMEGWDDRATGNWIANEAFVDSLLYVKDSSLTVEAINEFLSSTDVESIKALMK